MSLSSDSTSNWSQDIFPTISQIVPKNFIKNGFIIKDCPEEISIELAIVLLLSTVHYHNKSFYQSMFKIIAIFFCFLSKEHQRK
jgi:hypothetical protein